MTEKRTAPLSVRLSPELNTRLEESAKRLRMKKHTLAQEAIEAAVEAIEANGYKLVVPLKFDVTHIAVPAIEGTPEAAMMYNYTSSSPAKKEGKAADAEILDVIEKHHPSKPSRRK